MTRNEKITKLIVRGGAHPGREYVLQGPRLTLGSGRDCGIVLRDRYVAECHAVLDRRSDDVWIIKNHSVNGTFVNDERIDTRSLAAGDMIQIGPATTLEVHVETRGKGTQRRRERQGQGRQGATLLRRPGLLIGLGAYLLILVGVGVLLSRLDREMTPELSVYLVHRVMEESRAVLAAPRTLPAGERVAVDREAIIAANAEPAAHYYRWLAYKRHVTHGDMPHDDTKEAAMIEDMLERVEQQLFRAWNLELQEQWGAAIAAYDKVLEIIPDIRVPITRLAVYRQRKLREGSKP